MRVKKKTRLILLTIIGALIVLLVALGLSYAYMHNNIGEGSHTKIGANSCAKILLMEKSNSINLTNSYPMSENAALNTDPYSFGVRSTCSGNRGFKLYIVTIAGNTISANNIRYALTPKGEKEILSSGIVGQLSSGSSDYNATQTTQLSNSVGTIDSIYYAYEDNITLGEVTYYDLYMWVDGDTTTSVANKSFTAAVAILEGEYDNSDIKVRLAGNINTYDANVSCTGTNDTKWNPLTRQVEVFDISTKPTTCTVTAKTNTNLGNLKNIVEAAGYHETFSLDHSYVSNPQTILINSTNFTITQGSPYGFEDDTSTTGAMKNTNQSQDSTNSVITLVPKQAGGYNLCYTMSSEQNYDYGIIKLDTVEIFNTKGKNTSTYVCEKLGNITTSNTLEITYKKDSSTSSGTDTFSFYLEKGTYTEQIDNYDAGYRYEGEDPNNYVWFNNELWRIIGSVPTKIDSGGLTTTTNLVKIIRNKSIGGLVWNKTIPRPDWNQSTLYTLLNSYYYGAQNATGNTYCYGSNLSAKAKCDYRAIGINPTSYYGTMLKEVYWNTGASDYTYYPNNIYVDEISIQTMKGNVGIMNISDYGFASSYNRPTRTTMSSYNNSNYTGNDWLCGQSFEWTITPYSASTGIAINVYYSGSAYNNYVNNGYAIRPVVYLDSSVYVVSGDGSRLTPYKLGM